MGSSGITSLMEMQKIQKRSLANDKKFYCIFVWLLILTLGAPAIFFKILKDNATSNYCFRFEEANDLIGILKISPLPHIYGGREGCLLIVASKGFIKSNWYSGDGFIISGTNMFGEEMSIHLADSRECVVDEIFEHIRQTPFLFNVTVKGYADYFLHSKDMTAHLAYSCS